MINNMIKFNYSDDVSIDDIDWMELKDNKNVVWEKIESKDKVIGEMYDYVCNEVDMVDEKSLEEVRKFERIMEDNEGNG